MENKTQQTITAIETILNGSRARKGKWKGKDLPALLKEQRDTLVAFDRFNELEAKCSLGSREIYLRTLSDLGRTIQKPYETISKEDMQAYISELSKQVKEGTVELRKANVKRFFTWLEWIRINKDKTDEQKVDLKDVTEPYVTRWIKREIVSNNLDFEDLPTEQEILQIVGNVQKQRDRAYILVSWETGASPVEILGMRIRDVSFNQYGAVVKFKRYVSKKTKQVNELKTKYRERAIPISTSVPDLMNWLSMHPQKDNPDAPVWWSEHKGQLSYNVAQNIFKASCKKAGLEQRHFTLYSLRHSRITAVSQVLSVPELKEFCGHSKTSRVAESTYIHVNSEGIKKKLWKERGIEVKEEETEETPLTVKVCPRCKHQNSPSYKFCAMCSSPLDLGTMFEVTRKAQLLHEGTLTPKHDGNEEFKTLMSALAKLKPELVEQIQREAFQKIVVELAKEQMSTAKP